MNRFSLFLISLALTAFVCGCGNGNSHKGHSHGDEVSAEAGGHSDHAHGDEAHSHDHEDGHDHGHEGEGHLLLTAYSDGLEFFAETGTFVAGQEVSVLLHVTELQDFKPYVGEDVSVCLVPKGESAGDNCGNCSHGHGSEAEPEIAFTHDGSFIDSAVSAAEGIVLDNDRKGSGRDFLNGRRGRRCCFGRSG